MPGSLVQLICDYVGDEHRVIESSQATYRMDLVEELRKRTNENSPGLALIFTKIWADYRFRFSLIEKKNDAIEISHVYRRTDMKHDKNRHLTYRYLPLVNEWSCRGYGKNNNHLITREELTQKQSTYDARKRFGYTFIPPATNATFFSDLNKLVVAKKTSETQITWTQYDTTNRNYNALDEALNPLKSYTHHVVFGALTVLGLSLKALNCLQKKAQ